MDIAVLGTGYVGLVTSVCLSEIGHEVTCIDVDKEKVKKMALGISPIYEPGLVELMTSNINNGRLHFTVNHKEGLANKKIIYIAVGTPQKKDRSADLRFIVQAAKDIAHNIKNDVIIVTKSTVPVGTNMYIKELILENLTTDLKVEIVSNPEFLREGSAIKDTFYGDQIVIGSENDGPASILEKIYKPFGVPVFKTDIYSAEMIKYASNAFLASKISFINEMANMCEKIGANIDDVAKGMGQDRRIGSHFLRAGIGYGGSCFPKDTQALVKMAENVQCDLGIIRSTIEINELQHTVLLKKAKERFGNLVGKRLALLGLTYKPNTDDIRGAPSIPISEQLIKEGANIIAYDPVGMEKARAILPKEIQYAGSLEEALLNADLAFILTEWDEIIEYVENKLMEEPVIFDGRNCFSLEDAKKLNVEYHSIGRPAVLKGKDA
ncbi:UDP-glucose 6-dehydrogenase [Oceanobacillus arenosus]|uniref:UDP-glucose 6-dehydrogenase n=1 Tax=Oceanobacillus arenosus TaxID=1229153 RepID=A0A3D8PMF5_9BACI|nr:UDP-glucose/GDP-mannose dehydrogenase family protein [Oceanobacillus arenosus]RDW16418.1 UDP-glucose 6-dehydrogenase [Oceanobacillus arenosus]